MQFEGCLYSPVLRLCFLQPYVPLRKTTKRERPWKSKYNPAPCVLSQNISRSVKKKYLTEFYFYYMISKVVG